MKAASETVHVSQLAGLPCTRLSRGRFPTGRANLILAINKLDVRALRQSTKGSPEAIFVEIFSLPIDTRNALIQKSFVALGDEAQDMRSELWNRFASLPRSQRKCAEVALVRIQDYLSRADNGTGKADAALATASHFQIHVATLYRDLKRIEGVSRANWLPALARAYKAGGKKAEVASEVWNYFLSAKAASSDQPWAAIYRKLKKVAAAKGWTIPSLKTLMRRVDSDVSAAALSLITSGPKALDDLYPAQTRTVSHLAALEIVNLDGRRADLFVRWEDGEIGRPIVIALQDVMSRKMLGWIVTKTENADDTKAMLLSVMRQFGRFRKLRTDNSRAFASKKIIGGAPYQFRWKPIEDELTGILPLMGIEPGFALPANGRAKPIERAFKDLASDIDRAAEFKHAYCGNRPDAKPEDFNGTAIDIAVFREVFEREIAEHNTREGRRTEMAGGVKSFDQVFAESYALQAKRPITAEQERYFHSEVVYLAPNEQGALKHKGFTWWAAEYQDLLIRHHGTKLRVSFNPDSMSEAVAVETADGKLLAARLPCLAKGRFDSTEAARQHARGKSQYKKAAKASLKALNLMTRAELMAFDADARSASTGSPPPEPACNVVEPLFATKPGRRGKHAAEEVAPIAASGMSREEYRRAAAEGAKDYAALMRQFG